MELLTSMLACWWYSKLFSMGIFESSNRGIYFWLYKVNCLVRAPHSTYSHHAMLVGKRNICCFIRLTLTPLTPFINCWVFCINICCFCIASWIFNILHFWWNFSISVVSRYTQFKLQPKVSIRMEVINTLVKSKMAAAAILDFTKILITSVLIQLFGCNLNCVYLDTTEIGNFHQKCKILNIKDGGRRHLVFYQNVNNFLTEWAFGFN